LLRSEGIEVKIWHMPVEIPNPTPFDHDQGHASYHPRPVEKFWRILLSVDSVFNHFRAGFVGKSSPVHFFWGSLDLAVSRFSGHRAPQRPGADAMTQEAYSHEGAVSAVGRAAEKSKTLHFIPIPYPNHRGLTMHRLGYKLPSTPKSLANSF
jgi:Family of unknown function (DUF5996)